MVSRPFYRPAEVAGTTNRCDGSLEGIVYLAFSLLSPMQLLCAAVCRVYQVLSAFFYVVHKFSLYLNMDAYVITKWTSSTSSRRCHAN